MRPTMRSLLLALVWPGGVLLWADVIHFKDGRKLEGQILEQGAEVKIRTRFGDYAFPKSQIERVVKSKSAAELYQEKRAALKGDDAQGHYDLALWCKEQRLAKEMKEHLGTALLIDPDHAQARAALGYRKVNGVWLTEEEKQARDSGKLGAPEQQPDAEAAKTGQAGKGAPGLKNPDAVVSEEQVSELFNGVEKEAKEKQSEEEAEARPEEKASTEKLNGGAANAKTNAETRVKVTQLVEQAVKAIKEKRYDLAIKLLTDGLALEPDNAAALQTRGFVYNVLRRNEEAIADLNKALEAVPNYVDALFGRAMVYFNGGQLKESLADIEAVLKLQPVNENAQEYQQVLRLVIGGPKWLRTFTRNTAHYLVTSDHTQRLADLAGMELERIYREYVEQFHFKEEEQPRKFNVRIFATKESFMEYAAKTTGKPHDYALGYYSPIYKELILWQNPDQDQFIDTLYHEGFHQFLDYFISDVPLWFNEGLAQYFETAEFKGRDARIGLPSPEELAFLQEIFRVRGQLPIKKLLLLTPTDFMSQDPSAIRGATQANVHYAESWSFIHFLIHSNNGRYKRVIRDFYQELKKGTKADEAFELVFGKAKFFEVEQAWKTYVIEGLKD